MNREELPPTVTPAELPPDHPPGLMARFRNYFLTGLILVGPALSAHDFADSALYSADYDRRFRPSAETGRGRD